MARNTEWVYGLHAVGALLRHRPESVIRIFLQHARGDHRAGEIAARAAELGIPVEHQGRDELTKKAGGAHQGALALCRFGKLERDENFLEALLDDIADRARSHSTLLLILDGITDPHNLGACLRSAEAAGADAVIVPKDKSAALTATVRKVASGAAEIIPFVVVTNLARCLRNLQKRGIWVMGLAGEAGVNLYDADLTGPTALVLGAEGTGLRRLTREYCDQLLAIALPGETESLNVSVCAGICLFEAVRQRGIHTNLP